MVSELASNANDNGIDPLGANDWLCNWYFRFLS